MLRCTSVIGLLVSASAGKAIASDEMAPFDPVEGFAPPSIVFDDPEGKADQWTKDLPCGANRATVTVKFDKEYDGDRFAPVAKIWLYSGYAQSTSTPSAAAVIQAPTDAYKLNARVWLERVTGPASPYYGSGFSPADLNAPLQIDLAWTPDGLVSADFGGQYAAHIAIGKPIIGIAVALSWAKFEFIDLKVGHAGPASPACPSSKTGL